MRFYGFIESLLLPHRLEDEEHKRIAGIALVTATAAFSGLSILMLYRFFSGQFGQLIPSFILSALVAGSIVLLRHGYVRWSGSLLTWSLFGFLIDMIWQYDGLHDVALVAIPGVLVIASLVLRRRHFLFLTIVVLSSIAFLGYLDVYGMRGTIHGPGVTSLDVIDLLVILGVIAITVRSLSDALTGSLARVMRSEREMRDQTIRLRESEIRYRTLFEGANDAILIMDGERFIECNSMSVIMFGCDSREDLLGHAPWELSPTLQPDGIPSSEKARTIIQAALRGDPQRFLWSHSRKDGSLFQAEVSLNRFDAGRQTLIQALVRDVTGRMQMEDRLKKSEAYYRTLVETSPEAIVIVDARGKLVFASQKAHDLFEVPQDHPITGRSMLDWVAPEDTVLAQTRIREALAGEALPQSREYRLLTENKRALWCEVASSPLVDARGEMTGLLLVCHDVSERKAAEDLLRASEQQYRSLFENANDAIFIFDPSTEIILEANSKACELYGLQREDFVGHSLKDVSLNASWGERIIRQTLDNGLLKDFETVHVRKDHSAVHFLVNASVIDYMGSQAILSIGRDITDRKSAEDQLSYLSAAVQQSPASIVLTDVTGAIEYVNPRFTSLTGYTPEEALGKTPGILKSGTTSANEYRQLWETILAGGVWQGEFQNKRKDGSLYWEAATISPVVTGGSITHFLAIKEDITARKEMEERLRQLQKMESIGTLAGGIAHDFNNILSIILGHLSLIEIKKREPAAIGRSMDAMTEAIQRGASLVHQILTFARKSDVILEPVSVNQAIRDLAKMLQGTLPKTIEIHLQLEEDIPFVTMDRTQLHQALLNLCVNARDAMTDEEGNGAGTGVLRIGTRIVDGSSLRAIRVDATAARYVCVAVSDRGTGMNEETRRRVFEPFFTTKKPGKGTGLGLSVVYGVVKSSHGLIDVQSKPGEGTTFTMYFPAPENLSTPASGTTGAAKNVRGGSETILVVEDETAIATLLEEFLTGKGYRVLTAQDGLQALEIFSQRKDEIALVLTDMGLPKLDGGALVVQILERSPNAKVVVASGYLELTMREDLLQAGARVVIPKPYLPDEVLRVIRDVLDEGSPDSKNDS